MTRFHLLLAVASFAIPVVLGVVPTTWAQPPDTLDPPNEIATLLDRLRQEAGRGTAIRELSGRDAAAPYLRRELATAVDPLHKQGVKEALEAIDVRRYKRNLDRARGWVKDRRLDLFTEVLAGCRNLDAFGLADQFLPVQREIADEFNKALGAPARKMFFLGFTRADTLNQLAGESLTVPITFPASRSLIRANTCTLEIFSINAWLLAIRGELRNPYNPRVGARGDWVHSVVLVNNSVAVPTSQSMLIVCDGDAELDQSPISESLIVANGDVKGVKGKPPSIVQCGICATGDIVLPDRMSPGDNLFHAGGSIKFAGKAGSSERIKDQQKALPFGVRFLDPKEFGLELAAAKGGLTITKLAGWSPFAKHGVQEGDVLTKVNDVVADTVPAFRRELRRSILLESAVLHLRRGDEKLARVVFLDGIPTDPARTAPPPREARR
jgi:hypothetical protein